MTQSNQSISPLRQRMLDDMALRKLSSRTQTQYIRAVKNFTRFLGKSPDTADAEDLRRYQLHRVEADVSNTTINATLTGLKFFFGATLDRPEAMRRMHHVYQPRTLPEILSTEEVTRLLQADVATKNRTKNERYFSASEYIFLELFSNLATNKWVNSGILLIDWQFKYRPALRC